MIWDQALRMSTLPTLLWAFRASHVQLREKRLADHHSSLSETQSYWLFFCQSHRSSCHGVKTAWQHIGQSTLSSFPNFMSVGVSVCQSHQALPSSWRYSCCCRFGRETEERTRPSSLASVGQFNIRFTNITAVFNKIVERNNFVGVTAYCEWLVSFLEE